MAVIPVKVSTDKVTRLNTVLPLIEGGRVFIPDEAQWLDSFMDEAQSFPNGKHDDMIDALSMGLAALSKMGGQASEMLNAPINMGSSLASQFSGSEKEANWWEREVNNSNFGGWGEL